MISPLPHQDTRDLLRFLTAGSVDDGKSTLIGRLLHDSGGVYEDELASMMKSSSAGGRRFDPSLVTDGLKAEREQGITIDVAYRYFSTPRRKFIIADTPGHEQYTRNMVTGASTAQAVVLLMDARKGVLPQTRRHAYIASLLGIRTLIVALNKMDLVGFDQAVCERLRRDFLQFAAPLKFQEVQFIPMSALDGDNVIAPGERMPWYEGPSLLGALESVRPCDDPDSGRFRFSVQTVIRATDFRGYAGQIASGKVRPGGEVLVLPSGGCVTVAGIANYKRTLWEAHAPMSVVISLKEHTDLGRGDMLCDVAHPPAEMRRFRAKLIWMSADPLKKGEPYLIRHTTQTACMSVSELRHKTDIHTLEEVRAESLGLNEIGEAEIETHKPIFCDRYDENKTTGSFIVVHPISNATLAAGIILDFPSPSEIGAEFGLNSAAAATGADRGLTVWLTGLSGAGKTTICQAAHTELLARSIRVETLDGDLVREHLSRELGFSKVERDENIRRIGFVARLLARNGVVVLVSTISPYRAVRDEVRAASERFIEVFVNAPLEVCEHRDPKGLYKKARAGEFRGFTGVDDPYEPPLSPEIECRTDLESTKESVDKVVAGIMRAIRSS